MIKTILFDLGNVILPFDLLRLGARLSEYSTFSPTEILEKLGYLNVAHDFEVGRMSSDEYFEYVVKTCQIENLSYENFVPIFNDIFEEDSSVIELIVKLKSNYKLGLISNTNPIHVSYIKQTYTNLNHFDALWFSNEAKIRKPDPAIYHLALNHFQLSPDEAVFIDDMEPNIESANRIGIHGIHFKNAKKLKEDLNKLGVNH